MLDALTSSSDSDGPTVRFYSDIATLEDRVELLMHQLKSRQAGEPPPAVELQRPHVRKQQDDAANKTPSTKENGKPSPAGNDRTPLKNENTETEKEHTAKSPALATVKSEDAPMADAAPLQEAAATGTKGAAY